jgi:hypothetical protein
MKKHNPLVRTAPLVVLAVIASLLLQAPTYYFPLVFKNGPPPLYSTSYYIQNGDPNQTYKLGQELGIRDAATPGTQNSLVILDFGKMWVTNGVYGVRLFSDPTKGYIRENLSFAELEIHAKSFAKGYWEWSRGDNASHVTIGVGTNNYDSFNQTNIAQDNLRNVAIDFGRNWAGMINRLNAWGVSTGYNSQILFTGAIDIEWGQDKDGVYRWNTPYVTRGWTDAFDGNDNGNSIFFNYGACVGCPTSPSLIWRYNSVLPWTQADVWYMSWGAEPAFAIPEIYSNNGVLARQWAAVSKYGSLYLGSRIVFTGAMTQMQACQQRSDDPDCPELDNTPAEGWGQLVDAVNAETYTAQPFPQYSTDIKWQFK